MQQRELNQEEAIDTLTEKTALVNRGKGLSRDIVYLVLDGRRDRVSFRTADILLCATGMGARGWLTPELAPYYIPMLTCQECGVPLEVTPTHPNRKFCTMYCRVTHHRKNKPGSHRRATKRWKANHKEQWNAYMRDYRARKRLETAAA